MSDSSESSPKRREHSRSEEKQQGSKLFITNIDGKVIHPSLRPTSTKSKQNSKGSFKNSEMSQVSWPSATETPNTVLLSQR